jgi:hypothetical protein
MVKSRYMTFRLPLDVETELREQALKDSRTVAGQVLHYIKLGLMLDNHEKDNPSEGRA